MQEEQASEVSENTEITESSESQESTENKDGERPAGYLPVDPKTASPEQVQDRLNYLYRQVKDNGKALGQYRNIAQQQSQQINELMNGVGQVVDHLSAKSAAENENTIRQNMNAAFERGDTRVYLSEQEKLIDLKTQQKAPKQQNQTRQQAYAGTAAQVAQESEMSHDEKSLVSAWQEETDERGNSIRPWTKTENPNDPDPDFLKAMAIAKRVWDRNPNRSVKENLADVDKQMGLPSRSGGQNVMGGSLTTPAKKSKMTLSPNQERIAIKTKFGANKGAKSDPEYISAYRKQLEVTQARTKGSR